MRHKGLCTRGIQIGPFVACTTDFCHNVFLNLLPFIIGPAAFPFSLYRAERKEGTSYYRKPQSQRGVYVPEAGLCPKSICLSTIFPQYLPIIYIGQRGSKEEKGLIVERLHTDFASGEGGAEPPIWS